MITCFLETFVSLVFSLKKQTCHSFYVGELFFVFTYVWEPHLLCAHRGWKRASDPDLDFQIVLVAMWVQRTEYSSSKRETTALSCWVISVTPNSWLFTSILPSYPQIPKWKYLATSKLITYQLVKISYDILDAWFFSSQIKFFTSQSAYCWLQNGLWSSYSMSRMNSGWWVGSTGKGACCSNLPP